MFRNIGDAPKHKETINCLLKDGGTGDHLCALVAVNYIVTHCPWINLLVWVPDHIEEFAKNILPQNTIIRNYTKASKKYDNTRTGITTGWNVHTPMRTHPVDYAFHTLVDVAPSAEERNYLKLNVDKIDISKFSLPEKYVVVQAYATETVKRLSGTLVNEVVDYIKSKGYEVVFVGSGEQKVGYKDNVITSKTSEDLDLSRGIDLTNKTTLTEVGKIIANAQAFVGSDGGLMHVAGFTNTPIVCSFTFADWRHLLPIRNNVLGNNCYIVEPPESLGCKFCQTKMTMLYDHDFRNCYYKDYKCIKELKSKQFIKHLESIL